MENKLLIQFFMEKFLKNDFSVCVLFLGVIFVTIFCRHEYVGLGLYSHIVVYLMGNICVTKLYYTILH